MAVSITAREKAIYEADFAKFDTDGNGSLMDDEARRMALFQLGEKATDTEVDNLIAEMDKNNDGRIELKEYMNKILGDNYEVIAEGDGPVMGKQYCSLKDLMEEAENIYNNGSIPLVCAVDEDIATAASTFLAYKGGTTVPTKPLVGKAMQQGKDKAWEVVVNAASAAIDKETWLCLDMGNGAADLLGYAKEGDPDHGETTLRSLFDAREKDENKFKGLNDCVFVNPAFKVMVFSEFLEEDVLDFFSWGPFPLEQCRLLVIKDK